MNLFFSAAKLYSTICLISVTVHISKAYPTIKNPNDYGLALCSGVFISPNEILTAAHCVEHSRGKQWVKTSDEQSYTAVIESKDKIKDLAVLKIPSLTNHLYVSFGEPSRIGDNVYTVNNGDGMTNTYNAGVVNNLFEDDDTNTLMVLHSATIFAGASGSGLFDSHGRLVGINTVTIKSLTGAVDLLVIKEFLKDRS